MGENWYPIFRADGTSEVICCETWQAVKAAVKCEWVDMPVVGRFRDASPFGYRVVRLIIDDNGKVSGKKKNEIMTEFYSNPSDFIVGDVAVGVESITGEDITGFGSKEEAERVRMWIIRMYG